MNNLNVFNENNTLNFKNLYINQIGINYKFPNPNRNGERYIDIFDSMSGQILEEIFELNEEIKNKKDINDQELLYEFIDVLMYTGSLFIESMIHFKIDPIVFFNKHSNLENMKIDQFFNKVLETKDLKEINPSYLGRLRRKIYNRKYHKPCPKKPENYEENFLISIINTCIYNDEIDRFLSIYLNDNKTFDDINKYIKLKESYVLNL